MGDSETSGGEVEHYYIGKGECKKATCTMVQEFPNGDSPYCLDHALGVFLNGE
jgi:hypothetical protein